MINTRSRIVTLTALLLVPFVATIAEAQVLGPIYPAPGGTTFSSSGTTPISANGRTHFYSGFDLGVTADLWWTFNSIANPIVTGQAGTGNMAFSSFNAGTGIATWTSTANLVIPLAVGGPISTATKLVVQFQPFTGSGNALLGSGWLTPTTAGAESIPGFAAGHVFADVVSNFQVWFQYQTSSGTALGTYYDGLSTIPSNQLITSTNGAFYYTIPEPSTYGMLLGVITLGWVGWRRKRQA